MRYLFLAMILGACLVVGMFGFRGHKFSDTPVELFPDMDRQERINAQSRSSFFADGAGARVPVAGVLPMGFSIPARPVEDGEALLDGFSLPGSYFNSGRIGEYYGDGMPKGIPVDQAMLARGRERFGIYCAICHGTTGNGEGTLANFGNMRPIANLHMPQFSDPSNPQYRPDGEIFEIITIGRARMGPYGSVIPAADRWAIIAYVRALQDAAKKAAVPAKDNATATATPKVPVEVPATTE
ncbi:MAG: cytochrome c [Verrucomicrobiales bacterium]|jgi:mono/diheme cytochrome c family protein